MTARETNGSGSLPIEAATISEVLEEWLGTLTLDGIDAVRGALALALAREIDDDEAPRYAKPRTAAELTRILDSITASPRTSRSVARLLSEVRA